MGRVFTDFTLILLILLSGSQNGYDCSLTHNRNFPILLTSEREFFNGAMHLTPPTAIYSG